MTFSYEVDEVIHTVPKQQFASLYAEGVINENTLVFDNLIKTKAEWNSWRKPLGESWLKRFVWAGSDRFALTTDFSVKSQWSFYQMDWVRFLPHLLRFRDGIPNEQILFSWQLQ